MKIFRTYIFKWWQVSLFKLYLFSIGILFGVYFTDFFSIGINLVWAIVVLLSIYFITAVLRQKI